MRLKLSDHDSLNINHTYDKFLSGKTVWGNIPEPIDERSVYQHYGRNQDVWRTSRPDLGNQKLTESSGG
jgi:hypothetical protein